MHHVRKEREGEEGEGGRDFIVMHRATCPLGKKSEKAQPCSAEATASLSLVIRTCRLTDSLLVLRSTERNQEYQRSNKMKSNNSKHKEAARIITRRAQCAGTHHMAWSRLW